MWVYLNIDGVLHPNHLRYRLGYAPTLTCPGHTSLEYAWMLAETLDDRPDITVILNTWWTYYLGIAECIQLLPSSVARLVAGATLQRGVAGEPLPQRLQEAEKHIAGRSDTPLLVLDNSTAHYSRELLPYLLLVDEERGLSCPAAMRAIKLRLRDGATKRYWQVND